MNNAITGHCDLQQPGVRVIVGEYGGLKRQYAINRFLAIPDPAFMGFALLLWQFAIAL
jgi:hypothetical protein